MPSTLILTREGWVTDPETVFHAVQTALTETIGTPGQARHLRLLEFPATHVANAPGEGDRYTEVRITLFSGRTLEQKQALYAAVKRNLRPLDVPDGDVKVILFEVPKENWS